ncbi:hypothetical protein LCM20_15220 [Halobacillus litoralis]|uniref:hypothetical protein n=1 Tax=Halobacillus litoralis TaxID=45668 RepID=UPI001CD7EB87|nr:hypothetical protein [Halobacillus litoralis]MCA0971955.1 hypothetical protein [Halobacillus litoralis]
MMKWNVFFRKKHRYIEERNGDMLTGTFIILLQWVLLFAGIMVSALGLWEFRKGTDKRRFLAFVAGGALLIITSQALLQFIGLVSFGSFGGQ